MKILFITGAYPIECIDELANQSKVPLQNAPNVFQWALIDGFVKNNCDLTVACCPFIPSFPIRYKKLYTPKGQITYRGKKIGDFLRFNTLLAYKAKSIENVLYKYCKQWCEHNKGEKQITIVTYTSWPEFILPIVRLKKEFPNIIISSVITDLIDDAMNFAGNRSVLKRIQVLQQYKKIHNLYKYIDKFILLSKAMVEKIPEAIGKNIIIEGIYQYKDTSHNLKDKNEEFKIISYTGSIEKFVGINFLIDAFMLTTNPNYRLIICGAGQEVHYVKRMQQVDPRIIYKGIIRREEVLKLQSESTVLVNPRKPDSDITKYSFPSKTMEYLASGTPMIGYKLEGIPEEYFEYMYLPKDLTIESLSNIIDKVLTTKIEYLEDMAIKAREFILNKKNSKIQVQKILNFLKD